MKAYSYKRMDELLHGMRRLRQTLQDESVEYNKSSIIDDLEGMESLINTIEKCEKDSEIEDYGCQYDPVFEKEELISYKCYVESAIDTISEAVNELMEKKTKFNLRVINSWNRRDKTNKPLFKEMETDPPARIPSYSRFFKKDE